MIEASNLVVRRGGFTLRASFAANATGITAVFGPSGSGKSILLRSLAGLHRLSEGRVSLAGERLEAPAESAFTPAHLRRVGVVFQDARLFPHIDVRANLAFAFRRAKSPPVWSLEETARRLGVEPLLDRSVRALSGGERGRVALARALLAAPRMLLLDEPFAALDGRARRDFIELLLQLTADTSLPLMVVTHQVEDVAELADEVVVVRDGAVLASGPAATIMASPDFRAVLGPRDLGARIDPGTVSGVRPSRAKGLWLRADTVLLATEEPRGLSAQNVWPGSLVSLAGEDETSILAQVRTGAGDVLARISPHVAADLKLSPGARIWAVVKSHAF